jgi:dipeptidyl aminopeptidase/acylaminoacyl peptidase
LWLHLLAQNFEGYNSLFLETVFDTTHPNAEILKIGSPITYVSSEAPPFLIIHGDKDDVVSFEQSQIMYERLISSGASASLLMVKNAGHLFTAVGGDIYPTRTEITMRMVDFFDLYLK